MEAPLTASNNQAGKLRERIGIALQKSGVSKERVQLALEYPGTGLEDEIVGAIISYSEKASGLVTPVGAIATGLVPQGWKVDSDDLEGDVDLAKLDFTYAPCRDDEDYIGGDEMLKRVRAASAIGSLGFAKHVLDAQKKGGDIIPTELRGTKCIILSRTALLDRDDNFHVPYLYWASDKWSLDFYWLNNDLFGSEDVVPRVRE